MPTPSVYCLKAEMDEATTSASIASYMKPLGRSGLHLIRREPIKPVTGAVRTRLRLIDVEDDVEEDEIQPTRKGRRKRGTR